MRNLKDPDTWLRYLKICCIKFPAGKTKQYYRKKRKIKNTTEKIETLELQRALIMKLYT